MPKGYTRIEQGVYRTPERNYWVRASACHPRTGRRVNRSASLPLGASLREARSRLAELRVEIEELIAGDAPTARCKRRTLADCAVSWIRVQKDRVRPGTVEHYSHVLAQHVLPAPVGPQGAPFGELYADELSRVDVERWCRWAERHTQSDGRPYAKATVNGWWRVLCAFLRDTAADLGQPDPINRVKAPRVVGRVKKREQGTLSKKQLAAVVKAVDPSRYAEVYILAYTGLRPGELYTLEWGDVNWSEGCIHIRRSHRRGHVEATKTDAPRDVALTERLREVLEEHRRMSLRVFEDEVGLPTAVAEYLEVEKYVTNAVVRRLLGWGEMKVRLALREWCGAGLLRRCGPKTRPRYLAGDGSAPRGAIRRVPETPLIFPSRTGSIREPGSLHKPLADAGDRAGVGIKVGPQVLRRTFNTLMVGAGVDRTVLRAQMGHCSEEMTERYTGVSIEAKRAAVELIEGDDE